MPIMPASASPYRPVMARARGLLPLAVTVVLLIMVLRQVGVRELAETLSRADWRWVLVSVCLGPWLTLVSAVKWQGLLRATGHRLPLSRLCVLYLVGKFFSLFAPTNVGGDVVRGYELRRYTNDTSAAMASVIVERLTGLAVLVVMAIAALLVHSQLRQEPLLLAAVGSAVAGLGGMLWLLLDRRVLAWLRSFPRRTMVGAQMAKVEKLHMSIAAFRHRRGAVGAALLWSLLFMVLAVLNVYSSAMAFDGSVSLIGMATIVPIIFVVAMLPITVNGIGLQEWAYVILFAWIDLPQPVGLSTVILMRGKELGLALVGGALYALIRATRQTTVSLSDAD